MNKDYEEIIDGIFCPNGGLYNHRSLRTVFDQGSAEWDQTNMVEKKNIISKIIEHHNLYMIITLYKLRYSSREYIVTSVDRSLSYILCFILKEKGYIMSKMNEKKRYIWKLGVFLHSNKMVMSGEELADHLNRNDFLTSYGTEYQGGRGTYKLIKETWRWVYDDLDLQDDANKIAEAFVKPDGSFAYE